LVQNSDRKGAQPVPTLLGKIKGRRKSTNPIIESKYAKIALSYSTPELDLRKPLCGRIWRGLKGRGPEGGIKRKRGSKEWGRRAGKK